MSAFDGLKFNSTNYTQPQGGRVTQAIATASARTGVDFNYLMSQAKIESAFNPNARAQTSSATGLYQFIDQSWLAIVNNHGANHGMAWAANAIQKSGGQYYVADPAMRQQILDLRKHPETASVMAAELASDNRDYLEQRIGRQAEPVDLYLAHFLGAAGAAKFLTAPQGASGADLFPAAARANSSIFYDRQGSPRSLAEIRNSFAQKLGGAAGGGDFEPSSSYVTPDGMRMVQPADYMRIAQERLAQTSAADPRSMDISDPQYEGSAAEDGDAMLLNDIHALTLGRTMAAATPRGETARLSYLMLATLGR